MDNSEHRPSGPNKKPPQPNTDWSDVLLEYAAGLQAVRDPFGLVLLAQKAIHDNLGYLHTWLFEFTDDTFKWVRIFDVQSANRGESISKLELIDASHDAMIQEIATEQKIVVIEDARTDPRTNKEIVAALENRSIINVPLAVEGRTLGGVGMGTFGQEGIRVPKPDELAFLKAIGSLTAVALARVQREVERQESEKIRQELEAQVLHAQKLESLGVLAGGIAHDFNNLLVGVLGNANLAQRNLTDSSPAKQYIELIEQAALRAAELTHQMLAYSGKGKFVVSRHDLPALVREVRDFVASAVSKKVTLEVNSKESGLSVDADGSQIRQVLLNLLMNGAEAIGDELGTVKVDIAECKMTAAMANKGTWFVGPPAPGTYVQLAVQDTGCGMDAQTIEKMFEPFFTTKTHGRGLGMAAVSGILRGHRGALQVQSEPGQGTTFTVLLPKAAGAAATEKKTQAIPISGGGGRILVADDDSMVRHVMREMLELEGFEVTDVADGQEALECLRQDSGAYAGAIIDVTMPKLGGMEVIAGIRTKLPNFPIILTSGYSADETIGSVVAQPATSFLHKPFQLNELRRVLGQLLPTG